MIGDDNINLISIIKEIQRKIKTLESDRDKAINRITKEYDKQIKDLKTALQVNLDMNTTCLKCEGKKYIKVYSGMYEDRGTNETCDRCNGTGIEPPKLV
jgi:phage host-nuclease inhibitor protein Gam